MFSFDKYIILYYIKGFIDNSFIAIPSLCPDTRILSVWVSDGRGRSVRCGLGHCVSKPTDQQAVSKCSTGTWTLGGKMAQQSLSVHNKLSHLACAQPASDLPKTSLRRRRVGLLLIYLSRLPQSQPTMEHRANHLQLAAPVCPGRPVLAEDFVHVTLQKDVSSWFSLGIVDQACKLTAQMVCNLMNFKVWCM